MRGHANTHLYIYLIKLQIVVLITLWASTGTAGDSKTTVRQEVQFVEGPLQWVIVSSQGRKLPEPPAITAQRIAPNSLPLTRNLHVDETLLADLPDTLQTKRINTAPKTRWALCEDGLTNQRDSFTVCFVGQGTAVMESAEAGLRRFASFEGMYFIRSELEGIGDQGRLIAEQRAAAVRSIVMGEGADSDDIHTEMNSRPVCDQQCLNRVVVKYKPFK